MKLSFMGRKWSGAEALEWSVRAGFDVVGVITDMDNLDSAIVRGAQQNDLPMTFALFRTGCIA